MITIKKTALSLIINRFVLSLLLAFITTSLVIGQGSTPVKEVNKPVSGTYNSGTFLENQTVITNSAKCFELVINHRFGKLSDGSKEAWGIYSPSNIRFALNYAITNSINVLYINILNFIIPLCPLQVRGYLF